MDLPETPTAERYPDRLGVSGGITQRLSHPNPASPLSHRIVAVLAFCLGLFWLNTEIVGDLFSIEYLPHMGSIEGAYIGIARYLVEQPLEFGWFPLWYGGIPFENSYPPLLHLVVAVTAVLNAWPPALSYHAVTAATYCLGAVTVFLCCYYFSGRLPPSLAAGLVYTLVSPSVWLIGPVYRDVGSLFAARRLDALVRYGEGPHVASLTLIPVALLCLDWAAREHKPWRAGIAALAAASVVLTNWLGGFAFGAGVVAWVLSRPRQNVPRAVGTVLLVAPLAYLVALVWIPPTTIRHVARNAQYTVGQFPIGAEHAGYFTLALAMTGLVLWWLRKWVDDPLIRMAVLFTLFMGGLTFAHHWAGVALIPQPARYHLEFEMAFTMAAVFAAAAGLRAVRIRPRAAIVCGLLPLAGLQLWGHRSYAGKIISSIDVKKRIEYRAASWLAEHRPGRRVFVPGSERFWLNAFTDNPQLGGGFDQGITNPVVPAVNFGITAAQTDGRTVLNWLRAFGVDVVAVSGPRSEEVYKDFADPAKFEGVLPVAWRDGDDVIYDVQRRSRSLAHVIRAADRVRTTPVNAADLEPIRDFVRALEDPSLPRAQMIWRGPNEAVVIADLKEDQLVAVQISNDPGWRASVEGEPRRVLEDGLGLMLIEPRCAGRCSILLRYESVGKRLWRGLISPGNPGPQRPSLSLR